ncbi:DMT family transporter [Seohaeicola nanhaiensis]|uniref:DMT family transporter n=1 Tax=Seohaeicola nanhaiensis TaxID=1387282 RepID=A0ABV9KMM8_9RHOB
MNTDTNGQTLQAALLMVAAMAIIGVIDNYIARLAGEIGLWQFHFTRGLMTVPLVTLMSLAGFGTMRPLRPWRVVLRSLLAATAMLCYFGALGLLPIAQVLAGLYTSPIFIVVITGLFLRVRIGPWRVLAVAIGFAGTLFVLQPDPANFRLAILLPVAGGLFYALSAIATRSLCAGESTVVLLGGAMLALMLLGAGGLVWLALFPVEAAPGAEGFLQRGWVWPMPQALPWVVVQAVGSVGAVFLITRAYQLGEPSLVGVFEYSVMIFGPLYAVLVFAQGIGPWQGLGIGLIVLAGAIIAVRSR